MRHLQRFIDRCHCVKQHFRQYEKLLKADDLCGEEITQLLKLKRITLLCCTTNDHMMAIFFTLISPALILEASRISMSSTLSTGLPSVALRRYNI